MTREELENLPVGDITINFVLLEILKELKDIKADLEDLHCLIFDNIQ